MEIKKEDIDLIRAAFHAMQTREDLLALLNRVKPLLYGKRTVLFELRQITWYANPKLSTHRYKEFKIKKRTGGERSIHAPVKGLKAIQRALAFVLQCVYEPHQAANGFTWERSIISNAKRHTEQRYVYNLDLKDFFPSVDQARVWKCLQLKPFGLHAGEGGSPQRLDLANLIASICCTEMEVERMDANGDWVVKKANVLPQGAPTSPVLTNIVCSRLDFLLTAAAKRFGLRYTRYADDLTFSSMHNVYKEDHGFIKELHRIIADQHFHIKTPKTRLQKDGFRQEVTGLVVNKKVNVHRRYVKELRMWLNYWERYGYGRSTVIFEKQYKREKGESMVKIPKMEAVLGGKLNFVRMVKGEDDPLYRGLAHRYKDLLEPLVQRPAKEDGSAVGLDVQPLLRQKTLLPHDPLYTAQFLKNFKTGDGSGFKELVHDTDLSKEEIKDILRKVKNDPNFIYHYKKEKVESISFLNKKLRAKVIELIDSFEREGAAYFAKTESHPFGHDDEYTRRAKQFKKNYRYGNSAEYSRFQADIRAIFEQVGIPESSVVILPNSRTFNLRASFFSWRPALMAGLKYLAGGIKDHLNIHGVSVADFENKRITVQLTKEENGDFHYTELQILDELSTARANQSTLLDYLRGSEAYRQDFRNLCDWSVESDFDDERPARLNLLVAKSVDDDPFSIKQLDQRVGGYKNILRFYEVK